MTALRNIGGARREGVAPLLRQPDRLRRALHVDAPVRRSSTTSRSTFFLRQSMMIAQQQEFGGAPKLSLNE